MWKAKNKETVWVNGGAPHELNDLDAKWLFVLYNWEIGGRKTKKYAIIREEYLTINSTMAKVISLSLPEYNIDSKPDYQSIGKKIDNVLEEHFVGLDVAIRALSLTDHPKLTLEQFVKVILETGTDKYDSARKGVEGFENYDVDIQAGFCTIGKNHNGEGADIIQKFYENVLLDRGYRLRIDLLLIYDLHQLMPAEKIDPKLLGVHPRLEPYMYKFKDPKNKQHALLGVIKLLR